MSLIQRSDYSRHVKALREDTHRSVIIFFEKHYDTIRQLHEDEYFDILNIYLDALFQCGEYTKFLKYVEEALILSVDRRVYTLHDQDQFHHLLFRKAAAAYNCDDLSTSRHILEQLVCISPRHPLAIPFLRRCIRRQGRPQTLRLDALIILILLASVGLIFLEIVWIRPFEPAWTTNWEMIRSGLFVAGIMIWVLGRGIMRYKAWQEVRNLMAQKKQRNTPIKPQEKVWP